MDGDTCCGFAAAIVAILAFGSFAVPIKCQAVRKVAVDPLVLQTYKVGVCFLTSWWVLWWRQQQGGVSGDGNNTFTPYGLVSGLLMVPGGTAGYFGVRNAGLAVSQGIWSSLKVLVAFAWGLLVFGEPVHSITGTAVAILLMLTGLAGTSYFASSSSSSSESVGMSQERNNDQEELDESLLSAAEQGDDGGDTESNILEETNRFLGLSTKAWGIVGAVIDGLYGGSVLVPMHFAKQKGLDFLLSFAIGCWIVVLLVWLARFLLYAVQTKSWRQAWFQLPSMHVSTVGPYATLAGLVWSVGNVSSLLSVAWLGQGLGYSIIQSQLIVAGLWAVCWYGEIQGRYRIGGWFAFCVLTVTSILLLTRQHESMPMESSSSSSTTSST